MKPHEVSEEGMDEWVTIPNRSDLRRAEFFRKGKYRMPRRASTRTGSPPGWCNDFFLLSRKERKAFRAFERRMYRKLDLHYAERKAEDVDTPDPS